MNSGLMAGIEAPRSTRKVKMGRVSDAKERLMNAVMELIWTGSYGTTTIDQICDKAGVKKGSFYYFFESKAALAETAIRAEWEVYRAELDRTFSPTTPPLERLRRYAELGYQEQLELKQKHGYVLGCPMCSLGAEVSTQEANLRQLIHEIMNQSRLYLETAIRDAHAAGTAVAPDAAAIARIVYAYIEGLMTQARIQNNVELLREMFDGVCTILRVPSHVAAPA
jgi:TetR/AcrR family transcriptional regulator, transcriptional repressor for nem operon